MGYICRVEGSIGKLASRKGFVAAFVLIFVAATVVAALIARDSDRQAERPEATAQPPAGVVAVRPSDSTDPLSRSALSHSSSASPAPTGQSDESAGHEAASGGGGSAAMGRGGGSAEQVQAIPPAVRSQGSCPASLPRSECEANIRASQEHSASYPVTEQQTCPTGLSEAQCKAIFDAEASAPKGPSFAPEECLRYYSREQCAAVAEEFERQHAASQAGS